MENKAKERVGPLSRNQCELMKNYLLNSKQPSPEEIKDAGFPFFETSLPDKVSYSRLRFRAWAAKLEVTPTGQLVFAATGKELLPTEDIERVVMDIHYNSVEGVGVSHRKLGAVIRMMKEKYSIKRRAFGPSEDSIRAIVNSCPVSSCKFNLMMHTKQRLNVPDHLDHSEASVSNCNDSIAGLSAVTIQEQLKTAGMGAVSPPYGMGHIPDNNDDKPVKGIDSVAAHDCSTELRNWRHQIEQSTLIHQNPSYAETQSSEHQLNSLPESSTPCHKITPSKFRHARSAPYSSSSRLEGHATKSIDQKQCTPSTSGTEEYRDYIAKIVSQLSVNHSKSVSVDKSQYIVNEKYGGTQERRFHNSEIMNENITSAQQSISTKSNDSSIRQHCKKASEYGPMEVEMKRNSRPNTLVNTDCTESGWALPEEQYAVGICSPQDQRHRSGTNEIQGYISKTPIKSSVYEPQAPVKPQHIRNVSCMPGDPTISSKIFSYTQSGNVQPICTQANSTSRIILPKDLPHIFAGVQSKASESTQHGSQFGKSSRSPTEWQTATDHRSERPWKEQEAPGKLKCAKQGHHEEVLTNEQNSQWEEHCPPPKRSRWKEPNSGTKSKFRENNTNKCGFFGSDSKRSKVRPKQSRNRPIRPKPKESSLHGETVSPFVGKRLQSIVMPYKRSEIPERSFQNENGQWQMTDWLGKAETVTKETMGAGRRKNVNVNYHTEGDTTDEGPMEALWQEMHEKYKKEKRKQKLQIIGKIQKVIKGKLKTSPENGQHEANRMETTQEHSQSVRESRTALTALLARMNTERRTPPTGVSGTTDPPGTSDNTCQRKQLHVSELKRPEEMTPSSTIDPREEIESFKANSKSVMYQTHYDAISSSKRKRGRPKRNFNVQPRPPPAHTGSPRQGSITSPQKTYTFGTMKGGRRSINDQPIDLSMNSPQFRTGKGVRSLFEEPGNQVLDLSIKSELKHEPQENSSFGTRVSQVPVASIKPMVPKTEATEKVQNTSRFIRGFRSESSPPLAAYRGTHQHEAMETSMSSPAPSTDDDLPQVTSLHVSLYMKTPQKFERAEITSNTPCTSPYFQSSTPVKQESQCALINFKTGISQSPQDDTGSSPTSVPHKTLNFGGENVPCVNSECRECPSSVPNNVNQQVAPFSSKNQEWCPRMTEKRSEKSRPRKCTKQTSLKLDCEVSKVSRVNVSTCQNVSPNGVSHGKSVYVAFPGVNRSPDIPEPRKRCKLNQYCDKIDDESSQANVCNEIFLDVPAKTASPCQNDDLGVKTPTSRSERILPTSVTPTKGSLSISPKNGEPNVRPYKRERASTVNATGGRRGRRKKELQKSSQVSMLQEDQTAKEKQPTGVRNVESSFNVSAYLARKQIEAYEIKLKEAERRKFEILDNIVEQITLMRQQYRPCLLDLGKANLDKLRYAIQKLHTMVRDCRSSLMREEAATACVKALQDD